jgi:Zn-dependent metalloprotease
LKRLLAALILLAAATTARAIMAPKGAREDAKRFGFNHAQPTQRNRPSQSSAKAFKAYNANQSGAWKLRSSPRTGLPASIFGGHDGPHSGTPDAVARAFLAAHNDVLGVDPTTLILDRQTQGNGHKHVLYHQTYKGIPVDLVAVKVHLDSNGSVIGVQSSYEPIASVPTTPAVAASAAGSTAVSDAGGGKVSGAPTLAIVPLETDGKDHLAWKMRVNAKSGGGWRYYVDALTGQVLFRYSISQFVGCPTTSGTMTGSVYDIDPASTPGPVVRPFNNQYVYLGLQTDSPASANNVVTYPDPTNGPGYFCGQKLGKTAISLQGPYISVGEFRGPSANYNDGNGVWGTVATPISSPHPYAANTNFNATINLAGTAASSAVEFLPVFSDFSVGIFDDGTASGEGSGDIIQDDRLMLSDGAGNAVGNFIGARGAFNGAAVHGQVLNLTLKSEDIGNQTGYDVAVSSYLAFPDCPGVGCTADTDGGALSSHEWTSSDTSVSGALGNLHGEISLFYHLNLMHDYFFSDVDKSSAAPVTTPMVAMAHVGPNLVNAFYDPDYDDLSFGDISSVVPSDGFMDDATVPHHEYTHYMVNKIWSLQNYGQAGTLSEANADYWSASSLNDPAIGTYVIAVLCQGQPGCGGPLRQIDDTAVGASYFELGALPQSNYVTTWSGEIHDDSPFLSQALWDIRRSEIARLGMGATHTTGGVSCADGLVFQALLYFPESFSEMEEDMLQVDRLGAVSNCNGAGTAQTYITTAFQSHGISPVGGDAYEPNDGFETATDISTLGVVSATIYPTADTDFYSFGAGPGLVQISMTLPLLSPGLYEDYQLKLFNVSQQQVAGAAPPSNGYGTLDGVCDVNACTTTSPTVSLSYNNPTGGLLYVQVIAGDAYLGSNSGIESTTPYTLSVSYPQSGALSSALVSAKYDGDTIGFTVNTSTFVSDQVWRFAYAQLRDQSGAVIPNSVSNVPPSPLSTGYLAFVSSENAFGQITGSVQLANGFVNRFPSVGTVSLEVFAYDVHGSTSSMGVSNSVNLSDNSQSTLTAYNNRFNPLTGQKATVKYAVASPGQVTLKIYTITGRYVYTLFDQSVAAGMGSVDWGGQNSAGSTVASGIYVVRAVGPGLNTTQKIAVIK